VRVGLTSEERTQSTRQKKSSEMSPFGPAVPRRGRKTQKKRELRIRTRY